MASLRSRSPARWQIAASPCLWALAVVAWVALAGPAGATVLADWDLDELTRRSDLIVVAEVLEQQTVVDEEKRVVLTESVLKPERILFGKAEDPLVLTQIGGRAGSVRTEVVGDARLAEGDKVLLFTFAHEDGRRYLVGMSLGAWFARGGDELQQSIDSPVFDALGEVHPPPGRRSTSIEEVKAAIDRAAKAGPAGTSQLLEGRKGAP